MRISVPDDYPAVLAPSAVYPALTQRATLTYYDTLPVSEDDLIDRISLAEIVLNIRASSRFTARVFDSCPQLRLLSIWGTGTDHVDLAAAERCEVEIVTTPGVSARSIAEHTLALLFAVARRIPALDRATRAGDWPRGRGVQLHGKTCGVIGYGAVGERFAQLAAAIGMRVKAWTLHPDRHAHMDFSALEEIYETCDVISLHLRLSPETAGMIGPAQFAAMKPGTILLNTARGAIIDEAALIESLTSGRLAGAGLDVFSAEPLPQHNPLLALRNVVLTPHCAGITPEALEAGLRMAVENIWDWQEDNP